MQSKPMLRGRYSIVRQLGTGAQGSVFQVRDVLDPNTERVLKVFAPDQLTYAQRAMDILSQLASPHLPTVHAFFVTNSSDVSGFRTEFERLNIQGVQISAGQACFLRAYVNGESADRWREDRSWDETASLLAKTGAALRQMHRSGFLHGDLKPDNVVVQASNVPLLIDFGLSRGSDERREAGGTPLYLSPEVLRGELPTPSSERYSFGAFAYYMCEGKPPFSGTSGQVTRGHLEELPPEMTSELPARARSMISSLLDKDPAERPEWDEVLDVFSPDATRTSESIILPGMLPYVGRDREQETAATRLSSGESVWFHGMAGCGKTRLLRRVRWRLEHRGHTTIQVPRAAVGLGSKLAAVAQQLAGLSGLAPPKIPHLTGDAIHHVGTLRAWLDDLVSDEPPILIWDDADLLPEYEIFLKEYSRLGGKMPFAATSRKDPGSLDGRLPIPALTEDELEQALNLVDNHVSLSKVARKRVVEQSRGNPRALGLALEDRPARSQGGTLSKPARDVSALLSVVPGPLTVTELVAALSVPGDDVYSALQELLAVGDAVALSAGFSATRSIQSLEIAEQGPFQKSLNRLAALTPQYSLMLSVLGGATDSETVQKALQALAAQSSHATFHLLGAVVASGRCPEQIPALVRMAIELDQGAAALDYLPEAGKPVVQLARCRIHYNTGQLEEARQALLRLEGKTLSLSQMAETATLQAWIALREGRYADAAKRLEIAPAHGSIADREVAAELATARAATALLAGDSGASALFKAAVTALRATRGMPRLSARLLSYQAMEATRKGELNKAQAYYQQALQTVEEAGLDALLPTFLLNLATAFDHLGQLERARHYYRRGVKFSGDHVPNSTRILLIANQANISLRLKRWEEADELIAKSRDLAEASQTSRATRYVDHLAAELAIHRADWDKCGGLLGSLREQLEQQSDFASLCEVHLLACRAAVEQGDLQQGAQALTDANELITKHDLADRKAQALLAEGELKAAQKNLEAAVPLWEAAIDEAHSDGDRFRALEAASKYVAVEQLGERLSSVISSVLRSVLDGLGPGLRHDFTATLPPDIQVLGQKPDESGRTLMSASRTSEESVYRLLSLTSRLARESDYDRFLESAIDTAIELSGAERGFLLIRHKLSGFKVAVSRDVDGEPIRRAMLKVSRTIADQVAVDGEPLLTVDARADDRLGVASSVHRLSLTSVMCLPVRVFGEITAVIYLDHRFRTGAFGPEGLRLMMAFSDQLAVALIHIDRVRELEARNRELESARVEIQGLLEEKEEAAQLLEIKCTTLESDLRAQRRSTRLRHQYDNIIAASAPMVKVLQQVDRLVDSSIPVLVTGESGTGKELIARAVHYNGVRTEGPFVPINCGAISENLIESELFGHTKGAFTGADRDAPGLFRAAHRGTVFLDEIGELPVNAQVKLLRVLQDNRVRPVGGVSDVEVDVRIIAATNRDLPKMVDEGTFRSDLFYRLAGVTVELPPLRSRRADIPLLVQFFLDTFSQERSRPIEVTPEALDRLLRFGWPGNVRQLENVLRAGMTFASDGKIRPSDLESLMTTRLSKSSPKAVSAGRRGPRPKVTSEQLRTVLRECDQDINRVAERLSVTPRSVYRYLAKYQIAV